MTLTLDVEFLIMEFHDACLVRLIKISKGIEGQNVILYMGEG